MLEMEEGPFRHGQNMALVSRGRDPGPPGLSRCVPGRGHGDGGALASSFAQGWGSSCLHGKGAHQFTELMGGKQCWSVA